MTNELLSIGIPTYKRAHLLRGVLETLAAQMRDGSLTGADVTIYISDNASPDNTRQVAEDYQKQGLPLVYSRNEQNLGISKNLLKVIEIPKGRFVWTLGDDELLAAQALPNLVKTLRRHDPGLIVAFDTRYPHPLPAAKLYADYRALAAECVRLDNTHALAEHTLLSSNILRREIFQMDFALANIDTFFPHMFGMLRPLQKLKLPVLVPDFPVITTRDEDRGLPSDGVWSNLDACWAAYLGWLREELQLPELDPNSASKTARRAMIQNLRRHPLKYFKKNWRALFQPSAYRFFFKRLLGLK